MARSGQRGYGNAGRSAYSGGTQGAQSRAVFAAAGGFVGVDDAARSAQVESNTITLADLVGTPPLTITGGQYSKNGGAYTAAATTVQNGDTLRLRVTSSANAGTATIVTATIDGTPRSFTVTTAAAVVTPTPTPTPTPTITISAAALSGANIGAFAGTLGSPRYGDRPSTGEGYTTELFTVSGGNLRVGSDF